MKKSNNIHSKSPNTRISIILFIEPLDKQTIRVLETKNISDLQSIRERAKLLRKEAGWDAKEAKSIVDFYRDSFLINRAINIPQFERIKSYLTTAFRDWIGNPPKFYTPSPIKIIFTNLVIDKNPRYTTYGQIAAMFFMALSSAVKGAFTNS